MEVFAQKKDAENVQAVIEGYLYDGVTVDINREILAEMLKDE